MAGDFGERIDELIGLMDGGEDLVGHVEIDQVYAAYQHEGLDLRHPRGGQAKFLEGPLFEGVDSTLSEVAGSFLHDGGLEGMSDAVEDLSTRAEALTPVEFHDLADSGHPSVTVGDAVVYDRPPVVPRLTEEQLKAKARLRDLGFGGGLA